MTKFFVKCGSSKVLSLRIYNHLVLDYKIFAKSCACKWKNNLFKGQVDDELAAGVEPEVRFVVVLLFNLEVGSLFS